MPPGPVSCSVTSCIVGMPGVCQAVVPTRNVADLLLIEAGQERALLDTSPGGSRGERRRRSARGWRRQAPEALRRLLRDRGGGGDRLRGAPGRGRWRRR